MLFWIPAKGIYLPAQTGWVWPSTNPGKTDPPKGFKDIKRLTAKLNKIYYFSSNPILLVLDNILEKELFVSIFDYL